MILSNFLKKKIYFQSDFSVYHKIGNFLNMSRF